MSEQLFSKQELWTLRINEYRGSGLSALEWSSQNKLSVSTLRYWISKLNKQQNNTEDHSSTAFAELPLLTAIPFFGTAPVTIHMGNLRVEIADSCHPDLLSNLVGVLMNHA